MMISPDSVSATPYPRQLGAADLNPGDVLARRKVVLDSESFTVFASLSGDAHPIHYDQEYAAAQGLSAPIAHGLLVLAVTALGATELSKALHDSMLAMVSVEAKYRSPVYVNDEVEIVFTVADIQVKSKNRAVVSFNVDVLPIAGGKPHAYVVQRYLLKHFSTGSSE
ncbi:hypothetical protein ERD78_16535 [Allopusillimonas soli]|uniref:MaoC family dehydratase n=1 Tax=Allopusillimonas soli TaxID=659016 RepID=A0A853FD10_9BURK|nr:MaoC family dehydratase [Allopusillimonas soli]NYT38724.1 MaoC family dehydratase [Allopusillimonas soli]TEA71581.1 hypothetical protein ERD78_16535 [Allopusillimonas soli]